MKISRVAGRVCMSVLLWLCGSHVGEDSVIFAGLKDSILQEAKERLEERARGTPAPIPNSSASTKGSDAPGLGQSVQPEGSPVPPIDTTDPHGMNGAAVVQDAQAADSLNYAYRPEGRRDPFLAIVQDANKAVEVNLNVPPLQRVGLSEIGLIGIVWGGFGYIAMVQTPDGRGYTVREGTRIGSHDGLVSSITAEALTIKEPFLDIFGRKEMREHVIPLHPKVNVE